MATLNIHGLGDYIRDQRVLSQVSLRQLARQAGVSNPYLSQIERGLRKPSAEILQQIAKALRISAEALYIQAGILDERDAEGTVPAAVLADVTISERQKQVLLEIYDSFRKENEARADVPAPDTSATSGSPPAAPATVAARVAAAPARAAASTSARVKAAEAGAKAGVKAAGATAKATTRSTVARAAKATKPAPADPPSDGPAAPDTAQPPASTD